MRGESWRSRVIAESSWEAAKRIVARFGALVEVDVAADEDVEDVGNEAALGCEPWLAVILVAAAATETGWDRFHAFLKAFVDAATLALDTGLLRETLGKLEDVVAVDVGTAFEVELDVDTEAFAAALVLVGLGCMTRLELGIEVGAVLAMELEAAPVTRAV
jgi:hypothetical protein